MSEATLESVSARLDELLAEIRSLRAQAPEAALYCPRETAASYLERKGGRVLGLADDALLCEGGHRLQLSRNHFKNDARKAADDFFHALPDGVSYRAEYGDEQRFTMRHHNVWRSKALRYEQADALGLPGLPGPDDPLQRNGSAPPPAPPVPLTTEAPTPISSSPEAAEAAERLLAWARGRWGAGLTTAEVLRAAGHGDWRAALNRHDGDWRALATTIGRALEAQQRSS